MHIFYDKLKKSYVDKRYMRILIISDLSPPVVFGGIENYIINLSKNLIKRGHEVHWLTSKLPNTQYEEDFEGIKIHRTYIPFSDHYLFPGRQLFFLTSLIKGVRLAQEMDVIHVNTLVPGFLGWIIAKYSGKPSLLFCHEFYGNLWHSFGQNTFEKIAYPFFEKLTALGAYDIFACPSTYSKNSLMRYGVAEEKIEVIPHGVDFSYMDKSKNYRKEFNLENNLTFGYLGRLDQRGTGQGKNLKGLLEATQYAIKELPDAKLVLGGSGFNGLRLQIKKLGIEDNVIYLGEIPRNGTTSFMDACDAVVCPALSDGFCFLLAEASSCGVPVIGTNLGSHAERIQNDINGILVNSNSQSIADGIIKVLKNAELADTFGKNGIDITKGLDWEKSTQKHLEIYQRIVNKHIIYNENEQEINQSQR